MTVFILQPDDSVGSLNRLTARIGFLAMGEEVEMFTPSEADSLPLSKGDIVVGGIGYAQKAVRRLGYEVPVLESVPEPLWPFAKRRLWTSTLGDLRKEVNCGARLFAKPMADNLKSFDGTLFAGFRDLIATAHLPDETPIECAEPVSIVSEYRCFVVFGDPIDLRHYKGDPLVFPAPDTIRQALATYSDAPSGCAIDFGVTAAGETLVIEVNDGYAVGAYGLAPVRYAQLIAARWREIGRSLDAAP